MDDRISLIVPVFNSEHYLERCLGSLINQSYSNLEFIIVNDGSTDQSFKILQEYASRDERIKLFDKENGGIGSAYNVAFKHISGDYVLFVDSDDYLELNACEQLLFMAKESNADMVHFASRVVDTNGNEIQKNTFHGVNGATKNLAELENLFVNKLKHPSLINLYRASLFDDVTVFDQNVGIDEMLTPQLFINTKRAVFTKQAFCNVVARPDSVSRSKYSLLKLQQTIRVFDFVLDFTKDSMKLYHAHMKVKYLGALTKVLNDAFLLGALDNSDEVFTQKAKKTYKEVFRRFYPEVYTGGFRLKQIIRLHLLYLKAIR